MAGAARVAVVLAALALSAGPAHAYLHFNFDTGRDVVRLRWQAPVVRWYATDGGAPGVTPAQLQASLQRAFDTWEDVPTASIDFEFAGFTSALPLDDDDMSVFGFVNEPDLDRVLGSTSFIVDELTGEIVESDVFFNLAFDWSAAAGGDPARFDLESVALHEIGHFAGLGHSAIGETEMVPGGRRVVASGAVMFPISFGRGRIADRTLQPDDVAGLSDLYPGGDFRATTGAARGRVRRDGGGVLGAHVVAFNPATGALIGGFALNQDGDFEIAGLTPGAHVIRVEPLDDADTESFFSSPPIDIDFRTAFFPRLFVAPRGGVGGRFDVMVARK